MFMGVERDPVTEFVEFAAERIREAARIRVTGLTRGEVDALATGIFLGPRAREVASAGKDPYLLGLLETAMAERLEAGLPKGILDPTNAEGRLLDALVAWLERDHDSGWRAYVEELADQVERGPSSVWTPCYVEVRDALERCVYLAAGLPPRRELQPAGFDSSPNEWHVQGEPPIRLRVLGRRCGLQYVREGPAVWARVAVARGLGWRLSRRIRVTHETERLVELPGGGAVSHVILEET